VGTSPLFRGLFHTHPLLIINGLSIFLSFYFIPL
jgi:hypothetical protein